MFDTLGQQIDSDFDHLDGSPSVLHPEVGDQSGSLARKALSTKPFPDVALPRPPRAPPAPRGQASLGRCRRVRKTRVAGRTCRVPVKGLPFAKLGRVCVGEPISGRRDGCRWTLLGHFEPCGGGLDEPPRCYSSMSACQQAHHPHHHLSPPPTTFFVLPFHEPSAVAMMSV